MRQTSFLMSLDRLTFLSTKEIKELELPLWDENGNPKIYAKLDGEIYLVKQFQIDEYTGSPELMANLWFN